MSDKDMYTREQVKDILHSITYEDILTEDERYDIIRLVLQIYGQARQRKIPDCLIKAGLHNAVEIGVQKHYELGRN